MKEPQVDPETLALFLDGQLDDRRREEVLEQLAGSEELREIYADALVALAALDAGAGDPSVDAAPDRAADARIVAVEPRPDPGEPSRAVRAAPDRRRPVRDRWQWPRHAWPWLAAAVALVAVAPWATRELRSPADGAMAADATPAQVVALLTSARGTEPGASSVTWATTRAAGDPLTPAARAARIGARLSELALRARAADSATARVAAELASLLEELPASGPVAAAYRDIERRAAAAPGAVAAAVDSAGVLAVRYVDAEPLQQGMWLQAARVAAARRDDRFFRDARSRALAARALPAADVPAAAGDALRRLERGETVSADDWASLEAALAERLGRLGS